jgi:mannose-1-phosphate guanylyltransferase
MPDHCNWSRLSSAAAPGTRLWPVSREKHPKQLQPLLGGESLLQNTLRRLDGLPLAAPIVVSNQEYRFITAEQLRSSDCRAGPCCWNRPAAIPRRR